MVEWKEGWQLKHLAKDWVELVRDVVFFAIHFFLSNLHFQVWVRLKGQGSGRREETGSGEEGKIERGEMGRER